MARYYKVRKQAFTFDQIQLETYGETIFTEKERGLNEPCEEGGQHDWLLLPEFSTAVKQGGKQYCYCLKCGIWSHL